ncbi:MAG: V-type ATPase subunit [Acutalibacteraceae bacterium]|nr:V-type ATPase subunit [Acutalibacteraceae bacterium]
MSVKSVGFAIGNLRARENRLLKADDLNQLSAAKNTDELAKMLTDRGIGTTATADVPKLLSEETAKLWEYVTENAPDMSAFEPFLYENDFHNYKAVLKGVVTGRKYAGFFILPATVETAALERAVKEKRFDLLPDFMRSAAEEAYSVFTKTGDSQLADCIVDAGLMTAQLSKAKKIGNRVILKLVTVTVFYNNIKAALRAVKANKSAAFLETALTETGVVSKKAMITAALGGEEKLLELLAGATELGGPEAAEAYRHSPAEFEKFTDDRVINTAKECKYITVGIEPVVGYMLARKAEITDLRIIYSGIKTGQPTEKTRERLRELYG